MAEKVATARVANNVRAELARRRMTQGELAEKIGWKQQRLARRLCGEVDFTVDDLEAVASALDVEAKVLLVA